MGTNNLFLRTDGTVIEADHVNDYFTALVGDLVPRNESGLPTADFGSLGSNSLRWDQLYLSGVLDSDAGILIDGNISFKGSGARSINIDGNPRLSLPFPGWLQIHPDSGGTSLLNIGTSEGNISGTGTAINFGRPLNGAQNFFEYTDNATQAARTAEFKNIGAFVVNNSGDATITAQGQLAFTAATTANILANTLLMVGNNVASLQASGNVVLQSNGSNAFSNVIRDDTVGSGTANLIMNASTGRIQRSTSSIRYKKDVEPVSGAIPDLLLDLNPVLFRDKKDDTQGLKSYGFIAEEVCEVIPELATYKGEEVESVAYDRMPALIVAYLKKQAGYIADLEKRIEVLEGSQCL